MEGNGHTSGAYPTFWAAARDFTAQQDQKSLRNVPGEVLAISGTPPNQLARVRLPGEDATVERPMFPVYGEATVGQRVDVFIDPQGPQKIFGTPGAGGGGALEAAPHTTLWKTAGQNVPDLTDRAITWDSEERDDGGWFDYASSTSRIVVDRTGTYAWENALFFSANTTGYRIAKFFVNGVEWYASDYSEGNAGGSGYVEWSGIVRLNAGDYVQIFALSSTTPAASPVIQCVAGSLFQIAYMGGPRGPAGSTGPAGAAGAAGPTGAQGPQGLAGTAGAQGPPGAAGTPGATGAQGPQGVKGDKGDPGNTGATGAQGPAGATGSQGPQGATGAQGTPGQGFTNRGPYSAATPYVTNDAVQHNGSLWRALQNSTGQLPPTLPTTQNAYWTLIVAKGDTGSQGAAGLPGINWRGAWTLGAVYAVNDAVVYSGQSYRCKFAHTASGAPEFDTFTWELFAAKGATGATGSQGPTGPTGSTGSQGPAGATGAQGPIGNTGAQGIPGTQGPKGDKGDTGSQGPIGLTGPAGPQGPQGVADPAVAEALANVGECLVTTRNTTQNITQNTWTTMNFNAVVQDPMGWRTSNTLCTVPETGIYLVYLDGSWVGNTTGQRMYQSLISGASFGVTRIPSTTGGGNMAFSQLIYGGPIAAGGTIQAQVQHGVAPDLDVNAGCRLVIIRVK